MHKVGWLLIGVGALMLLGKGFFFLPFLIWPLLGMLLFRGLAHRHGGHGRWGHGHHGWHGQHSHAGHGGCGGRRASAESGAPVADQGHEPRGYTGDTTRL